MNQEQIRTGLATILEEIAGVDPSDVTADKSLKEDLDVDSLSMVEVVVAVEEKFGVKLPDEAVDELETIGDVVAYINRAASETTAAAAQ